MRLELTNLSVKLRDMQFERSEGLKGALKWKNFQFINIHSILIMQDLDFPKLGQVSQLALREGTLIKSLTDEWGI